LGFKIQHWNQRRPVFETPIEITMPRKVQFGARNDHWNDRMVSSVTRLMTSWALTQKSQLGSYCKL
jgi:hypothetical protein